MTDLRVMVVDKDSNTGKLSPTDLDELTQTGLGQMIYQCENLLSELQDLEASIED